MSSSSTWPIWEQAARELLEKLDGDESLEAVALIQEARAALDRFQKWVSDPPGPEIRAEAIRDMLELNRRVLEHTARGRS